MKKKCNKLIGLSLACLMILSLAACGSNGGGSSTADSKGSATQSSGTADSTASGGSDALRVGMECAYPPFNWTQTDGSNNAANIQGGGYAGGYDVQIAQKIAEGLGRELVIVKTEWDGLSPALTSGKIDMIIAGMSATKERKETIDFSDNYYTSDLVVVVKKDGKFASAASINDFQGAKITGQLNTFHYTVIDQMAGVDKQTAMETFPDMTVALQSGKIDGYVSERPGALSAVASNPDLSFVSFQGDKGFQYDTDEVSIAVGLAKGSQYTEKVNEILKGISEDERAKLMDSAIANQPLSE